MIKKFFQYVFLISIGFPLAFLLMLSFGKGWAYPHIFPENTTFGNWSLLLQNDSQLFQTFFVSLGISLMVATMVTALCFGVSKHIARSKNKHIYLALAYLPYLLSPVIMAVIFQFYFIATQLTGTALGVVIAQIFITFPFGIIILTSFWTEKIQALEHLSFTLGGSSFQTLKKVLLPLSKDALLLCFFQVFLISWFEYGLTNLIGTGKIRTLTVSVFNYINEANIYFAALASCLLIIPPMFLLYINKRFIFMNR